MIQTLQQLLMLTGAVTWWVIAVAVGAALGSALSQMWAREKKPNGRPPTAPKSGSHGSRQTQQTRRWTNGQDLVANSNVIAFPLSRLNNSDKAA